MAKRGPYGPYGASRPDPGERCKNSLEILGEQASCWLPKGHVGKCNMRWEGEEALRRAQMVDDLEAEVARLKARLAEYKDEIASRDEGLRSLRELDRTTANAYNQNLVEVLALRGVLRAILDHYPSGINPYLDQACSEARELLRSGGAQ